MIVHRIYWLQTLTDNISVVCEKKSTRKTHRRRWNGCAKTRRRRKFWGSFAGFRWDFKFTNLQFPPLFLKFQVYELFVLAWIFIFPSFSKISTFRIAHFSMNCRFPGFSRNINFFFEIFPEWVRRYAQIKKQHSCALIKNWRKILNVLVIFIIYVNML